MGGNTPVTMPSGMCEIHREEWFNWPCFKNSSKKVLQGDQNNQHYHHLAEERM
jgi:hypothetical protein